ncbi:MAG: hypothetical protein AAF542_10000 [Pseudomonadota bacterium]
MHLPFFRHSTYFSCLASLLFCLITSCASNQYAAIAIDDDREAIAKVVSVDQKRRPLSPDPLADQKIQVWFPAIAGHLFGTPNVESSWSAAPDDDGAFAFPLTDVASELSKMSQVFDASETALLLEPEDTRFARISSFAVREFDGELLGRASWNDPATRSELILVYFDRECRMLGSVFYGKDELRVDLQIPAAGLYWLRKHRTLFGATRLLITEEPEYLVLAIEPAA